MIALAGGLAPDANLKQATVERIEAGQGRRVQSLDLNTSTGLDFRLQAGDVLRIPAIRPLVENGVALEGHVFRPGTFAFHAGMRISDVITSPDDLKPRSDTHYVLVRREDPVTRHVSVFSADLEAALANRGGAPDLLLQARDRISVFDLMSPRDRIVEPLMEELDRQASPLAPADIVTVSGRINSPGRYPREPGMRIRDLIRAGGGLQDAAYGTSAELTTYQIVDGQRRRAELRNVDLAAAMRGDENDNVELHSYDLLTIKEMPEWRSVEQVALYGEVKFPGTYRIRRGETLASVLHRAGGLTSLAFASGAIFTREELKARESDQINRMADRLQSNIAALALQSAASSLGVGETLSAGQNLLTQLRNTKPVGRLVIDVAALAGETPAKLADVTLRDGDRLYVPRLTQEITVLGEVQSPTSHLYRPGLTRNDVIRMSGGFTSQADKARAYVVRANGSVVAPDSGWMSSRDVKVMPGDSVVVPIDAQKMRPLPLWTAVTSIIYNLAIGAAAIARL